MILQQLRLQNYRNYESRTFEFDPQLTYITGPNAHGKTNVLEAIHFLFTGKGIKGDSQEEIITFQEDSADIYGSLIQESSITELRIHLDTGTQVKKAYFVNKARKLSYTYTREAPPVVLFTPELISIVDDSPSYRRTFFDTILSKIDMTYQKSLRNYENGLRRRNKILESISDLEKLKDSLAFWNTYLIEQAQYIHTKRAWLVEQFNNGPHVPHHVFTLQLEANITSEQRFEEYFMKEFYQKRTLIGPQRDEFTITLESAGKVIDTKKYASRGEQRLALFWLILNQLALYASNIDIKPILLLDDIFSELDEANRHVISETISNYQTIITSIDSNEALLVNPKAYIIEI